MNNSEISIQCVELVDDIHALKPAWQTLHENSEVPSIYNSFVFIYESIVCFEDEKADWKVFTLTDNKNKLIAIFPMQRIKESWRFITFSSYEPIALNEIMDKPFPIIKSGFHDVAWQAFLLHLKNNVADCDHIFFRDIPSFYPALKKLPEICQHNDLLYHVEYDSDNPQINFDGNWDDFWQQQSSLRRKTRKLEKDFKGRFKFTVYDNNWKWCLEQYMALEKKSWKSGHGVTADEETIHFYYKILEQLQESGNLVFGFLTIDEQLVSALFTYPHGEKVYFPQTCYDPEFKKYSPSIVTNGYIMKYFYDSRFLRGDFLCGYADFLNKWSDVIDQTYDVDIYVKRPAIRLILALKAFKSIAQNMKIAVKSIFANPSQSN